MTPGARVAAAIAILDDIAEGRPAEQALTRWARASRFAGSKDRAAVRDHVFDVVREWRSVAALGGAATGRGRMIGLFRSRGQDPAEYFNGQGHAPAALTDIEVTAGQSPQDIGTLWDLPNWLVPSFQDSLGDAAKATAMALKTRAPVSLRVNSTRATRDQARSALKAEGVDCVVNPRADTALTVMQGARKIHMSQAFADGIVEMQDASSQAAVAGLGAPGRALDLCAGGGGKALALAASGWSVTASDVDPKRMKDIPNRAQRGGHSIRVSPVRDIATRAQFDLVFVDAPCSGSGTWRRSPDAKWSFGPERLNALQAAQREVLETASEHVRPGGQLIYATCSILTCENADQIDVFLKEHNGFELKEKTTWPVDKWGDGFFRAVLTRAE